MRRRRRKKDMVGNEFLLLHFIFKKWKNLTFPTAFNIQKKEREEKKKKRKSAR